MGKDYKPWKNYNRVNPHDIDNRIDGATGELINIKFNPDDPVRSNNYRAFLKKLDEDENKALQNAMDKSTSMKDFEKKAERIDIGKDNLLDHAQTMSWENGQSAFIPQHFQLKGHTTKWLKRERRHDKLHERNGVERATYDDLINGNFDHKTIHTKKHPYHLTVKTKHD